MATQGKIKTLYSDINSEEALFPRTKTNAVSDQNGVGLDAILDKAVYTKSVNDNELNTAPVNADTLNGNNSDYFASKSYVAVEIAKAQLDGEDVNIDLSGYATKDDLNAIDFPVDSINGKTGTVTLSASDVGARSSTWMPTAKDVGAMRNLGDNVVNNINNDTTAHWSTIDDGFSFYSTAGYLTDQPSTYGFLLHFKHSTDVFQIWNTQQGGPTYFRSGNNSGWKNSWRKVYDTKNKPTAADVGAAASSHTHSYLPLSGGTITGNLSVNGYISGQLSGDFKAWSFYRDTTNALTALKDIWSQLNWGSFAIKLNAGGGIHYIFGGKHSESYGAVVDTNYGGSMYRYRLAEGIWYEQKISGT